MEKCRHCGTDTELFVNGSPLCLGCVTEPAPDSILQILQTEFKAASRVAAEASGKFDLITNAPAGLPRPDGATHVHPVGHELSEARGNLRRSLLRLNKFLVNGEIPEDLKRRA